MSHFLEHMVFKGTARRTAEDVNREFDETASITMPLRVKKAPYYRHAAVLPEFQGPAVELLADIMRHTLREGDFGTEKQVHP